MVPHPLMFVFIPIAVVVDMVWWYLSVVYIIQQNTMDRSIDRSMDRNFLPSLLPRTIDDADGVCFARLRSWRRRQRSGDSVFDPIDRRVASPRRTLPGTTSTSSNQSVTKRATRHAPRATRQSRESNSQSVVVSRSSVDVTSRDRTDGWVMTTVHLSRSVGGG